MRISISLSGSPLPLKLKSRCEWWGGGMHEPHSAHLRHLSNSVMFKINVKFDWKTLLHCWIPSLAKARQDHGVAPAATPAPLVRAAQQNEAKSKLMKLKKETKRDPSFIACSKTWKQNQISWQSTAAVRRELHEIKIQKSEFNKKTFYPASFIFSPYW